MHRKKQIDIILKPEGREDSFAQTCGTCCLVTGKKRTFKKAHRKKAHRKKSAYVYKRMRKKRTQKEEQ